ncbi:MAG: hypothetical protein IT385_30550 [Deltaproteobacteria bacterium]|nr:hypothetical protein [Deltaproteobacteria bacterium]
MRKGVDPAAEAAGKQIRDAAGETETDQAQHRQRTRALTRGKQTLGEQEAALRPGSQEPGKPEGKAGAKAVAGKDPKARAAGDKGVDERAPQNHLHGATLRRYELVMRVSRGSTELYPADDLERVLSLGDSLTAHPSMTPVLRGQLEQAMHRIRTILMRMREGG